MKLTRLRLAALMGIALMIASGCSSSKDVNYFQELQSGQEYTLPALTSIKLQPDDKLNIIVSTSDSRLNSLFNLPVSETHLNNATSGANSTVSYSGNVAAYTIDSHGDINFPVLGKLHIAGMNREEVAEYIRRELISRDLAKNPIVTVEYLNLSVSVMGEVTKPGLYTFNKENFTILDAISAAGDLTIFGKRNNIKVLREDNGKQKVYEVNLNSGQELMHSPVYFMKQNDVIYVEPNSTRARTSTPNGNSVMTPSFWISIASFASTIAVLIIK